MIFADFLKNKDINLFLQYLYLIIIIVGVSLFLIGNKFKKKRKIRIKSKGVKKDKGYKNSFTGKNKIIRKLADYISFTNSFSRKANEVISIFIIVFYIVLSLFIYRHLGDFVFLWYAKLLNLIISIFLPYAILNSYITVQINNINKQLPEAFSEILSAYRSDKRIIPAINEAVQYMDKGIRREFKRVLPYLNNEKTFQYGLDSLDRRLNNNYVTLFCTLVEESRYKSSDITDALEKLVIKTRTRNYIREKAKRELVWYRIFLILWLFSIPLIMRFVADASLEAYSYYHTINGAKLLTLTMLSIVISYMLIMFMEKTN